MSHRGVVAILFVSLLVLDLSFGLDQLIVSDSSWVVGRWSARGPGATRDNEAFFFERNGTGQWGYRWDDGDVSSEHFNYKLHATDQSDRYRLVLTVQSSGEVKDLKLTHATGEFKRDGRVYTHRLIFDRKPFYVGESRVFDGHPRRG